MIIDERIVADGSFERIHLDAEGEDIVLRDHAGVRSRVRLELILAVVRRYGLPLDDDGCWGRVPRSKLIDII
jgi:hypothetical protein